MRGGRRKVVSGGLRGVRAGSESEASAPRLAFPGHPKGRPGQAGPAATAAAAAAPGGTEGGGAAAAAPPGAASCPRAGRGAPRRGCGAPRY